MTATWTPEAVLALAPDDGSAKAGQGLASARKWASLGRNESALWGEIAGSAKDPYQTRVDLTGPTFKCSCPSRKFPCKHGLGLLLIFAREPAALPAGDAPGWVSDWLAQREKRAERRADKAAAETAKPPDPEAQARRVAQREARVAEGLAQLGTWLADLVRLGFAHAQTQPEAFWEGMAARLVDAQAPGLGRSVRNLAQIAGSGPGWESRLLHAVARLELLQSAYQRQDRLDPALREDVRAAVGWTQNQDEVLAGVPMQDAWQVLGIAIEDDERLQVRRTWLWGRAGGRPALVLDFAAGLQVLDAGLPAGSAVDADLCFFPGALGLRAAVKRRGGLQACDDALPGSESVAAALAAYADGLARCPWLERWPMRLRRVRPRIEGREDGIRWSLVDAAGAALSLPAQFAEGWHLLAASGGEPVDLFGEWDGDVLRPLTVAAGGATYTLGGRMPLTPVRLSRTDASPAA
jgi:hypothetical protein